jgi:hypothetical protein
VCLARRHDLSPVHVSAIETTGIKYNMWVHIYRIWILHCLILILLISFMIKICTGKSKHLKAGILYCDSMLVAPKSMACLQWRFVRLSYGMAGTRIIIWLIRRL